MFIAANAIVIVIIALIAYWWANQGLFSALLHLLCVIVAGAIALAFWEPIVVGMLLNGGGFDNYAWGTTLILVFTVALFVLRLAADKLVPANLHLPHWANLAFGGAAGAAAGVLTMGIFLIGAGHMHSTDKLLGGVRGWGRDANRAAQIGPRDSMWVPAHKITSEFYGVLSVGALRSGQPLRHYTPALYQQATLLRDSYGRGRGKVSMPSNGASVDRLFYADTGSTEQYYVQMRFDLPANDYGEQLTLSSAQVRLIGRASGRDKADVVHPTAWRQHSGFHVFDDITHFASSEPGKESTEIVFVFPVSAGFEPRFIQVRGTRFPLPAEAQPAPAALLAQSASGGPRAVAPPVTGASIQRRIRVSNSIRPISVSKNMLPGSINEVGNLLTSGEATFKRGRGSQSKALRIDGIFEPSGTRCVRLDVSRGGEADIFSVRDRVEEGSTLALVDSLGNEYTPIGFFYEHGEGVTIKLEPTRRLRTIDEVPSLSTSGSNTLELIFYVTEGATVTGFRFGDIDIGHCDLPVESDES